MGRVQVPTAVTVLVVRLRAGVIAKLVTLLAGAAGFLFGFIGALYFSRLLKLDLVSQECAVAVGTLGGRAKPANDGRLKTGQRS